MAQVMKKYDVFLSFRGEDTRFSFTSHLHGGLCRRKIRVFLDDKLDRGQEISSALMNTIEESTISVVVLSEGYASSRWCLEELVKILDCRSTFRQIVLPVFYLVDPSHVRHQTGAFGDGFAMLVERFKIEKLMKPQMTEEYFKDKVKAWRNALKDAANLSGYTLTHSKSEFGLTMEIVEDVLKILNNLSPADYDHLVGIQPIINYIIKYLLQLDDTSRNIHTIGIWGMDGMGKTAIADALFNEIRTEFEVSYFASNVREKSSSDGNSAILRQELLSTLLEDWHSNMNFTFTKRRLGNKSVLIVFDDVTSSRQIESLIGDLNYLGKGSRVIITSINKQVLKNCRVPENNIYKVGGLSPCDALLLFSRYAFQQNNPKMDYIKVSNRIVKYAKGVPLALKVLGSSLFDKPREDWESAINKLETIPHEDIQEVLKVSYDGLNDIQKNIFLDVSCFLKCANIDFVMEFFNACHEFNTKSEITVLTDKCLITISDDNKIMMHNLLQKMGQEIVRQESTKYPGERSRLWHNNDIHSVLEESMGTRAIEGLCLDMSKQREIIHLESNALVPMRLRFFKLHSSHSRESNINKVDVSHGLSSFSSQLRYLCWHGYPLKSLPSNFHSRNLVALDMPHSNIEQLWSDAQLFMLKHIDLSHSKHLRVQDLSLAPNLESLILEGCTSLLKIFSSILCCNYKLNILNLRHCKSLQSLPKGVCLESLKKVMLSGCSNLDMFPEISSNIEELFLDETAIEKLPPSIENLSRLVGLSLQSCVKLESIPSNICMLTTLEHLHLSGCSELDGLPAKLGNLKALKVLEAERITIRELPPSIVDLCFLTELNLTNCCLKKLPEDFGQLRSLENLFLGKNYFESIPTSIKDLQNLSHLDLSYCESLRYLPELPSQLRFIDAYNCISLGGRSLCLSWEDISLALSPSIGRHRSIHMARYQFSNCLKLNYQIFYQTVRSAQCKLSDIWRMNHNARYTAVLCFPGNEVPGLFNFQSIGSFLTPEWHINCRPGELACLCVCVIVEFRNYNNKGHGLAVNFDLKLTCEDGTVEECHGILKGWDYGTGPDFVDVNHVFLGFHVSLKFSRDYGTGPFHDYMDAVFGSSSAPLMSIEDGKYYKMTIQFYVTNLNAEIEGCCKVRKCGIWAPYLIDDMKRRRTSLQ